jgi:hypothetical protein
MAGTMVAASPAELKIHAVPDEAGLELDHLLGTNLALWYEPGDIAKPGFMEYLRQWSPGLIRLPGGSWSNEYYWNGNGVRTGPNSFDHGQFKDGTWNIDYSDYAPGFRVHGIEQHLSDYHGVIDVKEQHELAEALGADQMVTVNVGTGSPEMAVEWLKWTRQQGYSVPYWEIGNELNGQWEVGHFLPDGTRMTGEIYAQRFAEYARALKAEDTSVKVGGPASSDLSLAFVEELLRDSGDLVDFVSFHAYPVGVQRTETAAKFADIDLLREALATIRGWKKTYQPDRYNEIEIAITEWNMKVNEDRDTADLLNALWCAAWIGAMLEGEVTLSNQWDLLTRTAEGGHGAFYPAEDRIIPTGLYWAHTLWGAYMGDRVVEHSPVESGLLESFVTGSDRGIQIMLINPSEDQTEEVALQLPEGKEFSTMARQISFSHRQYFWDPNEHRPLWSLPPDVSERRICEDTTIAIPPQSIQILEIPFAGKETKAELTTLKPGEPSLRLVLPEKAPADLPVEGWVIAWDQSNERPFYGSIAPVSLKIRGPVAEKELLLNLEQSVGRFFMQPDGDGSISIVATSGNLEAADTVLLQPVKARPQVIWTFDNPVEEWGASGTFPLRMEPSVKPNEYVANSVLENAAPGNNADILMLLESFSGAIDRERIGGVVGELQISSDFSCEDPNARINIILQSEADHWMPVGSIRLEDMRGVWKHYSFEIKEPRRLKAMARLYGIRFQLQSEAPVSGHVYFDNLGFLLRATD